ncbi:hypothetical protein DVQ78_22230 [Yersinia enterocolitica]|nr:hypothetical protein [Yersinia enterocolitica]
MKRRNRIYYTPEQKAIIQLLLSHKKLEITVRYLGIEVDDAIEISESIEVLGCQGCNSSPCVRRRH